PPQVERDAQEEREDVCDLVLPRAGKEDDAAGCEILARVAVRACRFAERTVDREIADDLDALARRLPADELSDVRLVHGEDAGDLARVARTGEFVRRQRPAEPRVDARRMGEIAAEILHAVDARRHAFD